MLKIQIADRGVALTTHPHRATRLQKRWNCTSSPSSGSLGPFKGELSRHCQMYSRAYSLRVTEWKRRVLRHSQTKPYGVLGAIHVVEKTGNQGESVTMAAHRVTVALLINNTLWNLGGVHNTQDYNSYLTANTLLLHYKYQTLSTVQGHNHCSFLDSYDAHNTPRSHRTLQYAVHVTTMLHSGSETFSYSCGVHAVVLTSFNAVCSWNPSLPTERVSSFSWSDVRSTASSSLHSAI